MASGKNENAGSTPKGRSAQTHRAAQFIGNSRVAKEQKYPTARVHMVRSLHKANNNAVTAGCDIR